MTDRYTTWGSVRGCCGHEHHSLAAAQKCLESDSTGCRRQGGRSDRKIRVITAGDLRGAGYLAYRAPGRAMTEDEQIDAWGAA